MVPHLFICYSQHDRDYKEELKKHLKIYSRQGLLTLWDDSSIDISQDWDKEIRDNLEKADIVVLLLSPDFMNTDFCYDKEMVEAITRHEAGETKVVPVFAKTCVWHGSSFLPGTEPPFSKFQGAPRLGKFIDQFSNKNEGWTQVAEALGGVIRKFNELNKTP